MGIKHLLRKIDEREGLHMRGINARMLLLATLWLVPLYWLTTPMSARALTAEDIAWKVYNHQADRTMHSLVKMDLVDRDGTVSTRYVEQWSYKYEGDLEKNVVVFHAPASIKGTRFLQVEHENRDEDQWIYLPALKRVRRIAAQESGQSFMGTDFSYEDMKRRRVEEYRHELLGEEELEGFSCYVIKEHARDSSDSAYSYMVRWVPKDIWVPIKIELYDTRGELEKVGVSRNLKQVQGYWTAFYSEMRTLNSGHRTILEFKKLVYDEPVNEGLFTTRFLETGRP
jgi:hypothetical protein